MTVFLLWLLFLILLPSFATSGEIYGRIQMGKGYIAPGTKIEVESNGTIYSTETVSQGSYRLYIPHTGKVTLKLYTKRTPLVVKIYSFDKPTRYDFTVESDSVKIK
jgi:hypothetical protein